MRQVRGENSTTRDNVIWLLVVRVLLLVGILLASLWGLYSDSTRATQLYFMFLPIAGLLGYSAVSLIWLRWGEPSTLFKYLQLASDTLIVTGIIYITGGPASPFSFLYLLVVSAGAILISRKAAFILTLLSSACFISLSYSLYTGFIKHLDPLHPIIPLPSLITHTIGLGSAMILISVAASYLLKQLALSKKQVVDNANWATEEQNTILASIPDGVVITDGDGLVENFNAQASALLSLGPQDIGLPLLGIIKRVDSSNAPSTLSVDTQYEITVRIKGENRDIIFHTHPCKNPLGGKNSLIFVFRDQTELRSAAEQLRIQERMAQLLSEQQAQNFQQLDLSQHFVGNSPSMKEVLKLIERVAQSDSTVLISGESGTGKELVARAIHNNSSRSRGPFVAVNCGAIPEELIESQLFGHKRGSFTSASSDHNGLFRQADGGTIFLDEIGELPLEMQAKLLRVLQERKVRPIGGDHDIPINVRLLSATNRKLEEEVKQQNFRDDLYYRLNVVSITLPPLRERCDDIPDLISNIVAKHSVGKENIPIISPNALKLLLTYSYPGNIRELENVLEHAMLFGGGVILPEHLPEHLLGSKATTLTTAEPHTDIIVDEHLAFPLSLEDFLNNVERKCLLAALAHTKGAKKKAADLLGLNFRSFRYRLEKYNLDTGE